MCHLATEQMCYSGWGWGTLHSDFAINYIISISVEKNQRLKQNQIHPIALLCKASVPEVDDVCWKERGCLNVCVVDCSGQNEKAKLTLIFHRPSGVDNLLLFSVLRLMSLVSKISDFCAYWNFKKCCLSCSEILECCKWMISLSISHCYPYIR